MLQPDGPPGLYADFTFIFRQAALKFCLPGSYMLVFVNFIFYNLVHTAKLFSSFPLGNLLRMKSYLPGRKISILDPEPAGQHFFF